MKNIKFTACEFHPNQSLIPSVWNWSRNQNCNYGIVWYDTVWLSMLKHDNLISARLNIDTNIRSKWFENMIIKTRAMSKNNPKFEVHNFITPSKLRPWTERGIWVDSQWPSSWTVGLLLTVDWLLLTQEPRIHVAISSTCGQFFYLELRRLAGQWLLRTSNR